MQWPPTEQLVDIVASIAATDSCDADEPAIELVSITSHQAGLTTTASGQVVVGKPLPTAFQKQR
jgi:hypothetical protein